MSDASADEFDALQHPLSVRDLARRLWQQARACVAAAGHSWRERAVLRAERIASPASMPCGRPQRDVLRIEARRRL